MSNFEEAMILILAFNAKILAEIARSQNPTSVSLCNRSELAALAQQLQQCCPIAARQVWP